MKKNIFNIVILMIIMPLIVYSNSMGDQTRNESPNSIKIELDFVSVNMSNYNPEKIDSIPENITFFFRIFNTIERKWAIGSYMQLDYMSTPDSSKPIWGGFYMVHGMDTIALGSRSWIKIYGNNIRCIDDSAQISGSILNQWNDPSTRCFFDKLEKNKKRYREYITDYIRNSQFIYIPIAKDYDNSIRVLKRIPSNVPVDSVMREVIYPDTLVQVDKSNFYPIFISDIFHYEREISYRDVMCVYPDTAYWYVKLRPEKGME